MKALKFLPLILAVGLAACGEKKPEETPPAATAPAPAPAPAPAAPAPAPAPAAEAPAATPAPAATAPDTSAPATTTASAGDLATGEKVFNANCVSCHGTGVMGAPKLGDKAAWGPRIAKGKDVLYTNSIKGLNLMPPRGGNAALKDEELKAVVDFMISKAG